ncbi:MAG TPA: carbohydrate porin [Verrucomicrobiae bacterium]|nr:carbohydrate porin [Verrucomicrobiae bacterium]
MASRLYFMSYRTTAILACFASFGVWRGTVRAEDTNGCPAAHDPSQAQSSGMGTNLDSPVGRQQWNWHVQNTDIVQGDFGFPAKYSGPNSLSTQPQVQETVTLDLFGGVRLWPGAEVHVDGLMWQGFGLSQTFGVEGFPNGDAYKAGTQTPDLTFARLFLRQTFGLGGVQEEVPDDQLTLAGKEDVSRLTVTFGRFTPKDIFDDNAYANDPHTQFLNWDFMGNLTWDYGEDTIGYTTGIALELNQLNWAIRYGFFQMPAAKNGFTGDDQVLTWPSKGAYGPFSQSWAMAAEFERRYRIHGHPGTIRFLGWLDEADFATYSAATAYLLANPPSPNAPSGSGGDVPDSVRSYRLKYGFGLSWDQELSKDIGLFSRLGWNDGQEETWTFTDVNDTASLGVSVNGGKWQRPGDTFALAGALNGASRANQKFLQAGGLDMLDGDGNLNYGWEKVLETYYDLRVWRTIHLTADYQFIANPAFNRDRGPVSIFGARLHWEL